MARIGIVVNPQAGGVRRDPALPQRLKDILGASGHLVVAEGKSEIGGAIEQFRDRPVEVIGIVGGDGSNLHTLTAATQVFNGDLPPLALLPGGSVNTVGRYLGVRGAPETLLRRLLHHVGNGGVSTFQVDTLRVNGLVGFIFGGALVGNFYHHFYRGPGKRLPDAAKLVLRAFVGAVTRNEFGRQLFDPVGGKVVVDGEPLPPEAFTLLLASTIDSHLGIRVTYRARECPGLFHMVASSQLSGELARRFPLSLLGRPLGGKGYYQSLARTVEITFDRPSKYIIDGDLYEGERVTLEPGPRLDVVSL